MPFHFGWPVSIDFIFHSSSKLKTAAQTISKLHKIDLCAWSIKNLSMLEQLQLLCNKKRMHAILEKITR